jgi:TonB family protein
MRNRIFPSVIFFCFGIMMNTNPVFSQRLITGRIIDKETKKPIKDAVIELKYSNIKTSVNMLGFFQLQIDSIKEILITSPVYGAMQLTIPDANNFTVELLKPKESSIDFTDALEIIYSDRHGFPTDKNNFKSIIKVIKHPVEKNKFISIAYDLKEKIKSRSTHKGRNLFELDGFFEAFYENGQKKEEGFFKENLRTGKWTSWYFNGSLKEESYYDLKKDFNERHTITTFYDSMGNALVNKGRGTYIEEGEKPITFSKGLVENGLKVGKWVGYFKDGAIAFEENYEKNELINGKSYNSNRDEFNYDEIIDGDYFHNACLKQVRYPSEARRNGIEGKVIAQIVFDSSGQIIKSRIVKAIGSGCDEEVLRIINLCNGKWHLRTERGQLKKLDENSLLVPVNFKLSR